MEITIRLPDTILQTFLNKHGYKYNERNRRICEEKIQSYLEHRFAYTSDSDDIIVLLEQCMEDGELDQVLDEEVE